MPKLQTNTKIAFKKTIKVIAFRVGFLLSVLVLLVTQQAAAMTPDTRDCSINNTWCYVDPSDCGGQPAGTESVPAGTLPSLIPEPYKGAFTKAASDHNVAPALLAALFSEENALGGDTHNPTPANAASGWANFVKRHPDPNSGWQTSSSGAQGPFQFMPATWKGFGYDISKINDLVTSADAAAKYAETGGATKDKPESTYHNFIFSYNQAEWYVTAVLKYYDYYNSQPGATSSGGSSTISSPAATCSCPDTSTTPTGDGAKTIVLDPGHAPSTDIKIDPDTKLGVNDYANAEEMRQVWDITQSLKEQLTKDGYTVLVTKKSEDDSSTNLKKRAEVGNQANAALGVSIHASPGGDSADTVFVPQVGNWRLTSDSKNVSTAFTSSAATHAPTASGFHALVYKDTALAATDLKYGKILAAARSKAMGGTTVRSGGYSELINSYLDRSSSAGFTMNGTMTTTQYFAKIPWLYNEQYEDAGSGKMSASTVKQYTDGLLKGVEEIVPLDGKTQAPAAASADTGSGSNCSSNGVASGDVAKTAVGLAWPEPFDSKPSTENRPTERTPTPAYKEALKKYNAAGFATTGGLGDDCGIFVATVMHATGADKDYPDSYTPTQAQYVIDHPDKYQVIYPAKSTSQLQPGDILILNSGTTQDSNGKIHVGQGGGGGGGHTFIYVGKQAGGYNQASASLGSRSANLDAAQLSDGRGQYLIARLKK